VIQVGHRTAPTRCASLPRKLERGLIFLENVAKKQTKWFISQILCIYTKVLGTDRFGTRDPYRSGPYVFQKKDLVKRLSRDSDLCFARPRPKNVTADNLNPPA